MNNDEFQTIHDVGITTLLDRFKQFTGTKRDEVVQGIGDDAAVFRHGDETSLLLSTSEVLLEGVHFDLTYTPLHHLGYKIVTAGVSDIIAMNGKAMSLSVNIAVPNKISVNMLEQLYQGIDVASKDYQVELTGGDTTASHQALVISVHVIGTVNEKDIIYRKGCKTGDAICVSGDLGSAIAGLRILLREKQSWKDQDMEKFHPDLQGYEYVIQRQLQPRAKESFSEKLSKAGVKPTSMMDLTQGLLQDLQILCDANNTGAEIFAPAVPIDLETRKVADEMKEDVDKYAFYGGEDYELLFTLKDEEVEKLKLEMEDFSVIGKIKTAGDGIVIQSGEEDTPFNFDS